MPVSQTAFYEGYFPNSPECWELYTEVLGAEFRCVVLFGHVHQLTVDTYAVQHAGGKHPDKSVAIHLSGLHLVLEQGHAPLLQRLASSVPVWPHFPAPADRGTLTVVDVALVASEIEHINAARAWARTVWDAWSAYHTGVADFVARHLARA
jgi:hypothetical protein